MKIKVQCPCGSRFEFEVEPVNGAMPVPINCPTCGEDATALANALIEQQLAGVPEPAAPATGLRIAHSTAHSPAPATAENSAAVADAPFCPRHKTEAAVEHCCVCGKPICLKCMAQFGYVCSVYCRQQATANGIDVPIYAQQNSIVAAKANNLAKYITLGVSAAVALLAVFWFWYTFFARDPKVVYSLTLASSTPDLYKDPKPSGFYRLIAPGQLLSVRDNEVSLYDIPQGKNAWSVPLKADSFDQPAILTTSNDVWLVFRDNVARLDRQSGSQKDLALPSPILETRVAENGIVVVSGNAQSQLFLSKISLSDGAVQTEDVSASIPAKATQIPRSAAAARKAHNLTPQQLKKLAEQANGSLDDVLQLLTPDRLPFYDAGPNVVEFRTKLLEHATISHQAMKAKGKSIVDDGNLTAGQSMQATQEVLNDMRRDQNGGTVEQDVSRYEVTLHRDFAKDIPDWTGEVAGPPQFFPLKTVDVIVDSQTLYVFDKNNHKLWEAKQTFPIATEHAWNFPLLETADALYFADMGILTRYDLATGNVRWRYNSVGISSIQDDKRGHLYIDTTTADPDSIQYSKQIDFKNKAHSVVAKLSASTGKVLWRVESLASHLLFEGKYLYATKNAQSYAALNFEAGPQNHFLVYLMNPSNGNDIWTYRRNEVPVETEFQKNWVMIQFPDQLVVLKFFSL